MSTAHRTLVVIFLRGGLDGVGTVVPHFEDEYHRQRPSLAFSAPKPGVGGDQLLPLDDRFALHPNLAPLLPAYAEGRLAIVHAFGSDDPTRSHFEAQDQMDHGASHRQPLGGGWIGRWLRAARAEGAFSAIAFGSTVPESLRGAPTACAVESLADVAVKTRSGDTAGFAGALERLHAAPTGATSATSSAGTAADRVRKGARDALALLERVDEIRADTTTRGDYPDTALARSLAQVAQLVRKDVGLRVATIDHGGFDTHFGQQLAIASPLTELGEALAAFEKDLGTLRDRVTVVCPTEFGRRIYENASLGTDHGRGSVAFVLGGGIRGGRVVGRWPGLDRREVDGEPVDLEVTTDFRDLFWELLSRRFGARKMDSVFPGLRHQPVGIVA